MEIIAKSKYVQSTPRKLRAVAGLVRRKNANQSLIILQYTQKKAAGILAKTIKTAIYNAINNFNLSRETLTIKTILIDDGPALVRFIAMARGTGCSYKKRTAHITVVLDSPETARVKKEPVATIKADSATTSDSAVKTTKTKAKKSSKKAAKPEGVKTEVKVRKRK